ncbi:unnamed protein product [Musa hybrid cultivar]
MLLLADHLHDHTFSKIFIDVGNEKKTISFDLRPSDAINMTVQCKVPIQVDRNLVYSDRMRVVKPSKLTMQAPQSDGMLCDVDRPDGHPCFGTEEFNLIQNMLTAAVEERYLDAAQWRDQLHQLRSNRKNWT